MTAAQPKEATLKTNSKSAFKNKPGSPDFDAIDYVMVQILFWLTEMITLLIKANYLSVCPFSQ